MTRIRVAAIVTLALLGIAVGERVARQAIENQALDDKERKFLEELCKDKGAGDWFRLNTGEEACRDVFQCTNAGLETLRCPHGLAFNLDLQTCDWKINVKNCGQKTKTKVVKPLLNTVEPLCQDNFLACGDGTCVDRQVFCDGTPDCADGSDETTCDVANDPNSAPVCNPDECALPDCYCFNSPNEVPHNLPVQSVPQMITITFDDAMNINNMDLYEELFKDRYNPNGCSIKGTFFVSHQYNNYSATQELHRQGHEIAVHSITHTNNRTYWTHISYDEYEREMAGSRVIIERFANITDQSILGVRNPFLRVAGNTQFSVMENNAFLYDSTITAPLSKVPLWPYTLYYRMPHVCHGDQQNCPTRSYAVWEMVMNEMDRREEPDIEEELPGCAMVDSCFTEVTPIQLEKFLDNNFNRHYQTNRAPFGLYFHSAFLKRKPSVLAAFLKWVDRTLATNPDVYFVTMTQVIQWMQDPRTVDKLNNYEAWKEKCVPTGQPFCNGGNDCRLDTDELDTGPARMATCMRCPNRYPWLADPLGEGYF